jgi:type I restriction enzyme S subunit
LCIGDYIIPKRGKNLSSKNATFGNVPVVAGGLSPSTYHNVANTGAPVITISASGTAGFINLWSIPVWAPDSSYIDIELTDDVYFWYIFLKARQQEIYNAQTGSVQPHIYPKHIAALSCAEISLNDVSIFTKQVTPFFEKIANNTIESQSLAAMRDALLPRLMPGELSVAGLGDTK